MKKLISIALSVTALVALVAMPVLAKPEAKIENKWDLSGEYVSRDPYNWAGMASQTDWTYQIHVKEAMDPWMSAGMIKFNTVDDIQVVGKVEYAQENYGYWSEDNLFAAGTTMYEGEEYYFMMLISDRAVWLALSDQPYESRIGTQTVWPHGQRLYQTHSLNDFDHEPTDPKVIHE